MSTVKNIKTQIDGLSLEKQLYIGSYANKKWTEVKQAAEESALFRLPTPITDSDRVFIQENKENTDIQRNKLEMLPEWFRFDSGRIWPRKPLGMEVFENIAELIEGKTMFSIKAPWDISEIPLSDVVLIPNHLKGAPLYEYHGEALSLIWLLEKKYNLIEATPEEIKQAIAVLGWFKSLDLLSKLLNYPPASVRLPDGKRDLVHTSMAWFPLYNIYAAFQKMSHDLFVDRVDGHNLSSSSYEYIQDKYFNREYRAIPRIFLQA